MCTRVAHSQSIVETGPRIEAPAKPYEKNIGKYVMMPGNAIRRHPVVEKRLQDLSLWAETASVNRLDKGTNLKMGILTSSTSYQYVKEVCGDTYPVLKLGMVWPLPKQKILDFAHSVEKLVVVEELDGFLEDCCRSLGLDRVATMRLIILPQALKNILPALCNEAIAVIKETSIVGLIAVVDLTRASDLVRSRTMQPYFPLLMTALIYFLLVYGLSVCVSKWEKRLAKSDRH